MSDLINEFEKAKSYTVDLFSHVSNHIETNWSIVKNSKDPLSERVLAGLELGGEGVVATGAVVVLGKLGSGTLKAVVGRFGKGTSISEAMREGKVLTGDDGLLPKLGLTSKEKTKLSDAPFPNNLEKLSAPWEFKDVKNINLSDLRRDQQLPPGNYRGAFRSEGAWRVANLYISKAAAQADSPAPVVTFLHGLNPNGAAEDILGEIGYLERADRHGAVFAMLHGRNELKGVGGTFQSPHDINFGYAEPQAGTTPYSDQQAFDDMMSIIQKHVPNADTENIAISGFSLGGKIAQRITAGRGDVAAVVSHHGTLDKFDIEIMKASLQDSMKYSMGASKENRQIDVMVIGGTADRVLPWKGGQSIFTWGLKHSKLSQPRSQAEFWSDHNSPAGPVRSSIADTANYIQTNWYSGSGARVTEIVVKGGAHAVDGAEPKHNFIQFLMGVPKPPSYFDSREESFNFMMESIRRAQIKREKLAA
jgi:poly(3-hydroxybutyrate) depolymerase